MFLLTIWHRKLLKNLVLRHQNLWMLLRRRPETGNCVLRGVAKKNTLIIFIVGITSQQMKFWQDFWIIRCKLLWLKHTNGSYFAKNEQWLVFLSWSILQSFDTTNVARLRRKIREGAIERHGLKTEHLTKQKISFHPRTPAKEKFVVNWGLQVAKVVSKMDSTNYRKYTFPNFPSDNLPQETPEKSGSETPRSLKAAEKKARNIQNLGLVICEE